MKKGIVILSRSVILAVGIAGLIWFLIPVKWNVWNIGNELGTVVCVMLVAGALFYNRILCAVRKSKAFRICWTIVLVLLCTGVAWGIAMTGCMLFVCASVPPENTTAVVLGSMVHGSAPSADLQVRIDRAEVYLKANPSAMCIASGGQGEDENVSEASAIKTALVSAGIEPERILTEDASRSTQENLQNSLQLARKSGLAESFAVVTDDYHEFRACSIARSLGITAYAIPAGTPWYIFSACWAREVLALAKYFVIPG